ncbi:hypothetical protein LTSESEN_4525, partial [Salmonella enterica subsp. enterica serovar Senftenberg str. A4-543]
MSIVQTDSVNKGQQGDTGGGNKGPAISNLKRHNALERVL